jgi:hypothetical protein
MIKIITNFDEVLIHILNLNWLYHFNWKVWLMWFHKKHLKKFFIQINISVLKKIFWWKITFIWKMIRIMLLGGLCIKIHFICLWKCYMKSKKNCPQNIPKYIPAKSTFSCLKQPPQCAFIGFLCFVEFSFLNFQSLEV